MTQVNKCIIIWLWGAKINFTKEERQWIIDSIEYFENKIKEDRHDDVEELIYLKNLKKIVEKVEEIDSPSVSFITKALRLYLKQYDPKIEDNIHAIFIVESILNKAESFLIKPIMK